MDENYIEKLPSYKSLGLSVLKERAELIKNNSDFKSKIHTILLEENEEKQMFKSQVDIEPEDSLYFGGFPENSDKSKMLEFHKVDWEEKIYIANQFKDERYQHFAHRLIYEEAPQTLPKIEYEKIHKIIAKQILSTDNEKWNTIPKSYHQLDTLRDQYENKKDDEKLGFLEELDNFLQNLEKKYQKI
jgi:exodeoxyribonuclease-1